MGVANMRVLLSGAAIETAVYVGSVPGGDSVSVRTVKGGAADAFGLVMTAEEARALAFLLDSAADSLEKCGVQTKCA
jgi:hypothetical protein